MITDENPVSQDIHSELQVARSRGLSRLLLLARRNFVGIVHAEMKRAGIPDMPDSCITILPYIDLQGTTASAIAHKANISKQAIVPLIATMETLGIVYRHPNPADGRSTLISFTSKGIDYLNSVHRHIDAMEDRLCESLGADELKILRRLLNKIIEL
jgi:DNA-binding MarR family transcriptional regulator